MKAILVAVLSLVSFGAYAVDIDKDVSVFLCAASADVKQAADPIENVNTLVVYALDDDNDYIDAGPYATPFYLEQVSKVESGGKTYVETGAGGTHFVITYNLLDPNTGASLGKTAVLTFDRNPAESFLDIKMDDGTTTKMDPIQLSGLNIPDVFTTTSIAKDVQNTTAIIKGNSPGFTCSTGKADVQVAVSGLVSGI